MLLDYDLSRLMYAQQNLSEVFVVATVSVEEIVPVLTTSVRGLSATSQMVQEATASDPLLQKVIHYHRTKWSQTGPDKDLQHFYHRKFSVVDGCIVLG